MKTTYAIVDIETTGTDPKSDRIIQFGCVLVENNKIVSRFATDINPMQPISKQIQNLTHISNKRVKKAPLFEDVATTIYNLLENTIFVAHNIHFDYHFLNHELERCGMPPLTIPGIDTVELAQIFLPTEVSFRLGDLAENLGLEHDAPHQADSDAEVTATLLVYIEAIMKKLPLVTMEKIAQLSVVTSMQTSEYIQSVVQEMRENPRPLAPELEIVDGMALRKKEVKLFLEQHFEKTYPTTKKEKMALYHDKLMYRKEQSKLMNIIYRHFTTGEQKDLLVEASTGMGKTIGYLLPAHFLATPEKPVIISTVSILLQQQLMKHDIPLLNSILEQPIQATVVKSKNHYIDLQRFKATLNMPVQQKQYALYQMGILVWLTQTVTGDFDELNLVRLNHLLFKEISHRGVENLAKSQSLYEEDFLRHLYAQMAQSNVLIINHALLAQETQRQQQLIPASPYLIIDEAHHLPDIMEQVSNLFVDTAAFQRKLGQFQEEGQLFDLIQLMVGQDYETSRLFQLYREELTAIAETQEDIFYEWSQATGNAENIVTKEQRESVSLQCEKNIQRLLLYYEELLILQKQLGTLMNQMSHSWLNRQRILFGDLLSFFDEMQRQYQVMDRWFSNWEENYVHFLVFYGNQRTVKLQLVDFDAAILPNTRWYERYERILYIGGTLRVSGDRSYFAKKLGIPDAMLKVVPTTYDYAKQAQLFTLDQGIAIHEYDASAYAKYLATTLTTLLEDVNQPVLVLFTSHDILQKVYGRMHMDFLQNGREILAQGMGGSREKLLKRFMQSNNSILFGADSFWEGVDLPGDSLQLLIVTRLPFENPERPMVKARQMYLEKKGINPFMQETIPKAALKLRQGLGRLIRSTEDKGTMIILDRRIVTTKYGKKIARALPKELPLQEASIEEIQKATVQFLENNKDLNENSTDSTKVFV
ncbi:ATP-dependent DNA helicase DinG [Enterococcus sp. DIV2402]|uniref:3'-5' exonuclease DinG n=1 Tax=Candidatus Enterococcus lowellii TaxID=2230877 RepID=A0ABZ2SRT5_9ENTE|nr:helicase C-terminal domain-containing protein [Enterococcus sp. DIV2402]MBO0464305.1 DEAD/DEAH box helicase family protein [Enterococcus sp. DIV2402]